jgi:site-specific DNA recombinase
MRKIDMRAAIYARYSSNNQREASIDDQIEVCNRYIQNQGWELIKAYNDAAISGASKFRPEYQQMIIDAESGDFDILVCEALDRLGRKLADIADLHDRLTFRNVKVYAVNTGEITPMHIGLLGTMAQLTLSDLRDKTKRGQLGRIRQGRFAGGKAYGYDIVESGSDDDRGKRSINTDEAIIIRRIYKDFVQGKSPRAIAKDLNLENIPGPEGRPWRDTTIRGQVPRGTGILNNATYIGRLEWNRCSFIKDPSTGKRLARPNPPDKWEVVDVPDLRIISNELWERVKTRQREVHIEIGRDEKGNALNRAHRKKFIFSGLLKCGECGGNYTMSGKDRYSCSTRRTKGTCTNKITITRQAVEERIFSGLGNKLMMPELLDVFVKSYNAEIKLQRNDIDQERRALGKELNRVERKIAGILKAIEDGMYSASMKDRMATLEKQKSTLQHELSKPEPTPVYIHPNLPVLYSKIVENLGEALDDKGIRNEAAQIIRNLVDKVVLSPGNNPRQLNAELYGELAGILAISEGNTLTETESQLSVVAGVGFEPTTFRL